MTQITTLKLAVISMMAGALLLIGAFLITTSMVSAQTPPLEPTPSATEPATPDGQRSREDCPKENGADGESTTGVRSDGPRLFRQ